MRFGRNCSAACCADPGARVCPPLPEPNPPTCMKTVTVPGSVETGAVYPDGRAAYYELNYTGSPGWVIHLSGGGWRWMSNKSDGATAAQSPPLFADGQRNARTEAEASCRGCYGSCDGLLSDEASQNPLFHEWNKVFVPITGDSFTGDRQSGKPFYMRGARVLAAVFAHLQTAYGLGTASDVILTGGSSGGLAVYLTCDRVAQWVRAANSSTRYSCLADAGFFMDHASYKGTPTTTPQFQESFYAWNSSAGTNQACLDHYGPLGEPWKCVFAEYVLQFIQSPLFVMQNLYDSWQLNNILVVTDDGCGGYGRNLSGCDAAHMAAVQAYGATMRQRLQGVWDPSEANRGIFAPSCIAHCQTVENEHPASLWRWNARWGIDGQTPSDVFGTWYKQQFPEASIFSQDAHGTPPATKVVQACDFGCNELCPLYT